MDVGDKAYLFKVEETLVLPLSSMDDGVVHAQRHLFFPLSVGDKI